MTTDASHRGRPTPATPETDLVAAFAAELRAMRERAGSPSYRTIGRSAHFSISTLAEAMGGKRLPTEQVVRAIAAACGEDPDDWSLRLHEANRRLRATTPSSAEDPSSPTTRDTAKPATAPTIAEVPRRRARHHAALGVAAVAIFVAGFAVAAATGNGTRTHPPTPAATTQPAAVSYPAQDGDSPVTAGCTGDAQLLDKASLMQSGTQIGALELKYSDRCHAGWARVYLYPAGVAAGLSDGPVATVTVAAADGTASSYAGSLDKQRPNFTDAITPHGGCLKATATLAAPSGTTIQAVLGCDAPSTPPSAPPPATRT